MAPAQILERLDERFRMLTGGSRTAVARHQTLQAAVDWSYELLSEPNVSVLDRLSVFAGGSRSRRRRRSRADDEIDAFDVLEHVSALVDKSLVVADPVRGDVPVVGDDPPVRRRPVGRLGNRRRRCAPATPTTTAPWPWRSRRSSPGRATSPPCERLSADIENLRLMLDWYHDHGQADIVADVILELGPFWFWRGHALEIIARLEATIDGSATITSGAAGAHAHSPWMKAGVGFLGIPEHAERCRRTRRARWIPTTRAVAHRPRHLLHDLRRRHRTGDRADPPRHRGRSRRWSRLLGGLGALNGLTYMALLAPGTDETLRFADEVRDVTGGLGASCPFNSGSRPWRLGLFPGPSGPLAGDVRRIRRARNPREASRSDGDRRVPGRSRALHPSALCRLRDRDAAIPGQLPRLGQPSRHDQRALRRHRLGRPHQEDRRPPPPIRGPARRPRRVRTSRLGERALRRGENGGTHPTPTRATRMPTTSGGPTSEATVDLALEHPRRHRRPRTHVARMSGGRGIRTLGDLRLNGFFSRGRSRVRCVLPVVLVLVSGLRRLAASHGSARVRARPIGKLIGKKSVMRRLGARSARLFGLIDGRVGVAFGTSSGSYSARFLSGMSRVSSRVRPCPRVRLPRGAPTAWVCSAPAARYWSVRRRSHRLR